LPACRRRNDTGCASTPRSTPPRPRETRVSASVSSRTSSTTPCATTSTAAGSRLRPLRRQGAPSSRSPTAVRSSRRRRSTVSSNLSSDLPPAATATTTVSASAFRSSTPSPPPTVQLICAGAVGGAGLPAALALTGGGSRTAISGSRSVGRHAGSVSAPADFRAAAGRLPAVVSNQISLTKSSNRNERHFPGLSEQAGESAGSKGRLVACSRVGRLTRAASVHRPEDDPRAPATGGHFGSSSKIRE
jgi:hypothetical protein